jgi:hypothetical protein
VLLRLLQAAWRCRRHTTLHEAAGLAVVAAAALRAADDIALRCSSIAAMCCAEL